MQPEREGHLAGLESVLADSIGSSYPWAVGFFFTNPEFIMELWTVTADIPKISTADRAPARDLVDQ